MKPSNNTKKKRRRKKKASASSQPDNGRIAREEGENNEDEEEEERNRAYNCLVEAFSSASIEEVDSAYQASGGDANKAAEILSAELLESCGSGEMGAGEAGNEVVCGNSLKRGRRQKILTASTGTVSSVIGKGYLGSGGKRTGALESRAHSTIPRGHEEALEFLFSMIGDDCHLDFGVIRDVFCQCGYDVEKALDALLEISASSNGKSTDNISGSSSKNSLEQHNKDLADGFSRKYQAAGDSTSFLSEKELHEVLECVRFDQRSGVEKSYLPQKVLESLFSVPESSEHNPSSMNWKSVVKKMESFGQELEFRSARIHEQKPNSGCAKEDDYQVLRKVATQQWDSTKSYYQKAAAAYSRGERAHAVYLSEQGRFYHRKAHEADEKASQEIFEARNKDIKNAVTIDLHGQQVKEAIRLLKLHLILFTYLPSIQFLTVITGCGTHGPGKATIKQSVISLVKKEGIEWSEENRGTIVIRLDGRKEFSFLQSEGESD